MTAPGAARSQELTQQLGRVRERVEAAAQAHGRDVGDLTLIVVTKYFPASDVAALMACGVGSIGESRDQEASAKIAQLRDTVLDGPMPRVHMIGQVQTKKARSVVRYADAVHSVDRTKLAGALDRGTSRAVAEGERSAPLDVTVQVDLAGGSDVGRGGVRPDELPALADLIASSQWLRLRGLMAIAPDPARVEPRAAFEQLAGYHQQLLTVHPGATWMSAGMSGDLEEAVAAGATHLRVGSAILGSRPGER
ncbi:YggS family pyridoxal phosphate-dependent enzyme [soil metagenome]